ncbi:MAG: transglycosylase SLT domain-containing protein [Actinomycetia bacterium]|nr:transglycosylase SLT domain-containing protein [Actinomycetes bacterium]
MSAPTAVDATATAGLPAWTPSRSVAPSRSNVFADRLGDAMATSGVATPDSGLATPTVGRIMAKAASALPGLPGLPSGMTSAEVVARAHRHVGVSVPVDASVQRGLGVPVESLDEARAGDVLLLGGDVAVYLGHGQMVSVPEGERHPAVTTVDPGQIVGVRRLVTDAPSVSPLTVAGGGQMAPRPASVSASPVDPGPIRRAAAPYSGLLATAGRQHQLDPALLTAVASVESAFDPSAVSSAGAQGLMQFMPATAASFGIDPLDPAQAIDGAGAYLRQLLDQFGSLELALAGYNAGPGAVTRSGGIPPYAETRSYVTKVLDTYEVLR